MEENEKNEEDTPRTTFAMWGRLQCKECGGIIAYYPPEFEFIDEEEMAELYCFLCATTLAGLEN